MQTRG